MFPASTSAELLGTVNTPTSPWPRKNPANFIPMQISRWPTNRPKRRVEYFVFLYSGMSFQVLVGWGWGGGKIKTIGAEGVEGVRVEVSPPLRKFLLIKSEKSIFKAL